MERKIILFLFIVILVLSVFLLFKKPDKQNIIETKIDTLIVEKVHTIKITGKPEIHTEKVIVYIDSVKTEIIDSVAVLDTLIAKDNIETSLNIKYYYRLKRFDINLTSKFKYDIINKTTVVEKKEFIKPVINAIIMRNKNNVTFGIGAGIRLKEKLDIICGINTNNQFILGFTYKF